MRVPGGGASCLAVRPPGSGALPPPTSRPFGRAAGAHYPLAVGAGGVGWAPVTNPTARALASWLCALWWQHEGARGGCLLPGCGASGDSRSPTPKPLVRSGVLPGPSTHWLWVRGVQAWGPVTNHTARAPASSLCALWGQHEGARGGAPLAWVSGVRGRALSYPQPLVRSGVRPGPTTHWLWVRAVRAWGPVTNPTARALACCGGGMGVSGGGASCLGVGCPGSGALPPPTTRPFGRAAGAHYPLAVGAGGVGVGTRHQPHSARPCKLALSALGAARGRPGGAPLAWVWGVRGRALSHPRPPVLSGVRPGPVFHLPWVRCGAVLGTLSRAAVRRVLCALPGFAVPGGCCGLAPVLVPWLWPAACLSGVPRGPALVRRPSSGPVALGAPVGFPVAVVPSPTTEGCRPRLYWAAARGTWRPAENQAHCACYWPLPRQGCWARSASYLFGAPRWGCPWQVLPASVLGCVRCGGLACVDPVTDASGFPYCPSCDRGLGRCTGAVSCGRRQRPFRVGGRHARVPRVSACACPAWPGWAGRPPRHVLVRPTFLLAVLGALFACSAPSGLGLPGLWLFVGFSFLCFSVSPLSLRPRCVLLCVFSGPGCLGPWRLAPPPFFFFPPPPPSVRLRCVLLCVFSGPGCLGPVRLVPPLPFFLPPPPLLSLAFPAFRLPWASAPPPFFFAGCALPGGFFVSWAVRCACVCLAGAVLSLLCVRWLLLCGVGCWA